MRVGIIGIGGIAKMHLAALKAAGQNIVALCDVRPERAEAANERFEISATVYTDYEVMLDEAKLDAVHICTPHYLHVPVCCAALKRNVHVLCEKPLAISEEQLTILQDAVAHSSARLAVCHQNRFNASVRYVKNLIGDRPVGAAVATLAWKRDEAYYAADAWRGKWETEGGGVMINQALHTLDLLQWICGYPVSVQATVSNLSLKDKIEVEDTAFGRFMLPTGGNFLINATNAASMNLPITFTFRCEEDTIVLCRDTILVNGKPVTQEGGKPIIGKEEWGTGHATLIAAFYQSLADNTPFMLDFDEGSKVVRLILGMYASNGQEIKL